MKISSVIKKPIYSALIFFGTLGVLSAGYAGFVTLQSSDADSGKSLTSTMMQAVIGNLADLDTRVTGATTSLASLSGAVSSLQISAGSLWTTVTGGIGYSGGNVGIGTSTPNSLLHVYKDSGNNAELDLQSVAGTNKHWGIYQNRADESLRFWNNTAGGDSVTVTNGGRVGIGTSAPTQKLHVVGNTLVENGNITIGRTAADYSTLVINNTSGVQVHLNANGNSEGNLRTVTNHPLSFSTNNIERMKIDTAGNVGIGTTSPQGKLEVTHPTNAARTIIGWPSSGGIWGTNAGGNLHIDADKALSDWRIYLNWYNGKGVAVGNGAGTYGTISAAAFSNASDRRLKEGIQTIVDPLEKIKALRGVTFQWKSDNRKDIGFIAQEVEEVTPELVITDAQWYKGVRYSNVTALLVEAVKELKNQKDTEILELKKENENLKTRINALEQK